MLFKKKNKLMMGVDISSTSIKMLELSQSGSGYRVESYAVEPLPEGAVSEKTIRDEQMVGRVVAKLKQRTRTKLNHAAVAVAGSAVISKIIEIQPIDDEDELEAFIEAEAEQYIPFAREEVALDYYLLGPSDSNPDMYQVYLAACKQDDVDARMDALKLGGLLVLDVDIESQAIERAFRMVAPQLGNTGLAEDDLVAVVDIGHTNMTLNVLRGGQIVYTRDQAFGGGQLTQEVMRTYGMNLAEAGLAKKQPANLPADYESEILLPFMETMVQQIQRAFQYFYASNGSSANEMNLLVLAGGTACLPGLADMIEEKLGTKTLLANPFANMQVSNKVNLANLTNDAPALMIACGLAMRSFEDGKY